MKYSLAVLITFSSLILAQLSWAQDSAGPPDMQAVHAAAEKCNIAPGTPPSSWSSEQMQCMDQAGFTPPHHGHGEGGPHAISAEQIEKIKACFQADNVTFPAPPEADSKPELTDAQKSEFQKCRSTTS